jgi:opacity protein-like surface antigen
MKTCLRFSAIALAAAFAVVHPSRASGFYFKAAGLYNSPADLKVSSASAFKASLKDSTGVTGALGYKLPLLPLRAEAELQYFKNGFGGGSTSLGSVTSITGDTAQFTGFLNGYFDVPTSFYGLAPYVGAGVGLAKIDFRHLNVFQGATNVVQFSGHENAFAWQVMAGLQFHLFGAATLNAGYRFVRQDSIKLTNAAAASALQSLRPGDNHIFELGVAIGF